MEEEQGERRRIVDDDIVVVFPKTWKLETRQRCQRMGTCVVKKVGVLKWNKTTCTSMEKKTIIKRIKKIQSNLCIITCATLYKISMYTGIVVLVTAVLLYLQRGGFISSAEN